MTATLAQILDEMANTIRDVVADVTDVDVQVEPRMVLNPTPPTIDMYPADPSADPGVAGFGELLGAEVITVRVVVSGDQTAEQDLLLAFMDDEDGLSIAAALHDDSTLGGLAADVEVRSRSGYALFPFPAEVLVGCTFSVVVIKARS